MKQPKAPREIDKCEISIIIEINEVSITVTKEEARLIMVELISLFPENY